MRSGKVRYQAIGGGRPQTDVPARPGPQGARLSSFLSIVTKASRMESEIGQNSPRAAIQISIEAADIHLSIEGPDQETFADPVRRTRMILSITAGGNGTISRRAMNDRQAMCL
jgi:hypothetical protein